MTRPKVGNSLPGVAIAVALAPPLAVAGVSLQSDELSFALGAFLLFLTNLVGIVVASGVAYILSGYSPWTRLERSGEQGKKSLVLVGLAVVLVAFPLALIGDDIVDNLTATADAESAVDDWLGEGTEFSVAQIPVSGSDIEVIVVGQVRPQIPMIWLATWPKHSTATSWLISGWFLRPPTPPALTVLNRDITRPNQS